LFIAAFAVGVGMALLVFKYGPVGGGGGGGTTIPIMVSTLALAAPGLDRNWRMIGAGVGVVVLVVAFIAFAFWGWGLFAAILFAAGLVVGASGPPMAILMFRDGIPLGGLLGIGLAIAAQIAFGEAACVRRDDGTYEWTVLRTDGDGYYAELADGRRVGIKADKGELFSFGFGKLAVTEAKTDRSMQQWQVTDTPGDSTQPTEERAGVPVHPPRQQDSGTWLVSLANIQRAIRGSASSTLIRRGRDKALEEEGGQQQLSQLWTMGFTSALLVGGFVLASGVFLL
jgi:hypothetical protein